MTASTSETPGFQLSVSADTIVIHNPRTDEVVGEHPVMHAVEVEQVVARAHAAARSWSGRTFRDRRAVLTAIKREMASSAEELASIITDETGKPRDDAMIEVMLTVTYLDWAAKHARAALAPRRVWPGLAAINQRARVCWEPLGVVGVIGPWNYPLWTPMGSISFALAAGNTVVFKPSELTIGIAVAVADIVNRTVPEPIMQVISGYGDTGAALIRSGVDKIAFTGSPATAKKVMTECSNTLTPVVIGAGGNDAMIVCSDADLDRAADLAVFGAVGNAGQTCAGVERIYVEAAVRDEFLRRVVDLARQVKPGESYGPLTLPQQKDTVRNQVTDALAAGATALLGGIESIGDRFVAPVVLADVPDHSSAMCEETFGPTIVVNTVTGLDEAIELANSTEYGLGASIFTSDTRRAERAANSLRAGAVTINSVLGFAAIPALPFGGLGESGFGRIHGREGLREFSRTKSIAQQRFTAPVNVSTMFRNPKRLRLSERIFRIQHTGRW